jgi:hypothetical protein
LSSCSSSGESGNCGRAARAPNLRVKIMTALFLSWSGRVALWSAYCLLHTFNQRLEPLMPKSHVIPVTGFPLRYRAYCLEWVASPASWNHLDRPGTAYRPRAQVRRTGARWARRTDGRWRAAKQAPEGEARPGADFWCPDPGIRAIGPPRCRTYATDFGFGTLMVQDFVE